MNGDILAGSTEEEWAPMPCDDDEARLTVIQITDTYTLEHLASVKTLVQECKAKSKGSKVVAMMTGDFLAPYLLSSVDRGFGMMNALAKIPIDYVCWGNHVSRQRTKNSNAFEHSPFLSPLVYFSIFSAAEYSFLTTC